MDLKLWGKLFCFHYNTLSGFSLSCVYSFSVITQLSLSECVFMNPVL